MQVFLSYAREDRDKAERLYQYLKTKGIDVWMDEHNLIGGQRWNSVIKSKIQNSTVFLACISKPSTGKTGFVQEEFKIARSHQDKKPLDHIFIIPVIFEECELPEEFSEYQCVDLTSLSGYEKVYLAVEKSFEVERHYGRAEAKVNSLNYQLHSAVIAVPEVNIQKKDFVFQSPMPGVFYRGPSPEKAPYCREGDEFLKGDGIFIIECFKLFFEFQAPEEGIVGAFLAENGEYVAQGSPLFLFYFKKNRKNGLSE